MIFQKEPDTQSLIKQLSDFSITCSDFKSIIDAIQSYYIKGLLDQFNEYYHSIIIISTGNIWIPLLSCCQYIMSNWHSNCTKNIFNSWFIVHLFVCLFTYHPYYYIGSGQQKIGQYTDIWNMILYDLHSTNLDVFNSKHFLKIEIITFTFSVTFYS